MNSALFAEKLAQWCLSNTLIGEEVQEILKIAESGQFATGSGTKREENITEIYFKDMLGRAKLGRKLKILLNTANATSSFFSPKLFRDFGCEVVEHNTTPDPSYPNYVPNPANVEMMTDTGKQVVKNGCDIGIAIDADGDRLGVTDEKGEIIWPDRYIILLARLVLAKKPGAKIIFDVKVSEALPEDIRAHGGVPIMWKTGHSHIKKKLHDEQAPLAGEQSGHIFFVEGYYGFDDANFAALKLLEYISAQKEPLSKIIESTPYYVSTPAYHAHAADNIKYGIVEKLTKEFKDEKYRVIDINGARVYFPNGGWGLIRASSNLPALVIRFEAKNEKDLKEIEAVFRKKLTQFPEVATEWESA
jgi:phosphomannomutase/phosphoglucomutase